MHAEWSLDDTFVPSLKQQKEFESLREILRTRGRSANDWHPRDSHAETFAIDIPKQLGTVTPHSTETGIVLSCERGSSKGTESFDMVRIERSPDKKRFDVFFSDVLGRDPELSNITREILERPLWHFIANMGTREYCVFCPQPLSHGSSKSVGYGQKCAKDRHLYFQYHGPETTNTKWLSRQLEEYFENELWF